MIGIVNSLSGLAKSYIDAKTAVKITEAEIKKKQLTGEIDWEQSAIEASKDSWKDELWTLVFVVILVANFIPSLQETMARGFANLETTPLWVPLVWFHFIRHDHLQYYLLDSYPSEQLCQTERDKAGVLVTSNDMILECVLLDEAS